MSIDLRKTLWACTLAVGCLAFIPAHAATSTGTHMVLDSAATGGAFWLRPFKPATGIGVSWKITNSGANLDWDGTTATLTGKIVNRHAPLHKFGIHLEFSGLRSFSDGQTPKCGSRGTDTCGGNELNWSYFSTVAGRLTGRDGLYGVNLDVTGPTDAPDAQLGFGANDMDLAEGMSSPLSYSLSGDSHFRHFEKSGLNWRLASGQSLQGDMNIALDISNENNVPEIDAIAGLGSLAALGAMLAFIRGRRRTV